MKLPNFVQLNSLRNDSGLVAAWDAVNLRTDQPIVVLQAPEYAASMLETGYAALHALRQLASPPTACPEIVAWDREPGAGAMLVFGGIRGKNVEHNWAMYMDEATVLALAAKYAKLLSVLH